MMSSTDTKTKRKPGSTAPGPTAKIARGASGAPRTSAPPGILTFDVEDWQHANFAGLDPLREQISRSVALSTYRMDKNVDLWIDLLGRHGATSTCFVLGEFARRYPDSVRKLQSHGHEIACHGMTHDLIHRMSREGFRESLRAALGILGGLTGRAPAGFRAPSWSADPSRAPWFCEELERAGLRYDSSEFPARTPLFGDPKAPTRPYRVGSLLRVPVTILALGPARIPFSSGAFFRLAPLPLIRLGFRRALATGAPAMAVLHPRELDPDHPRLPLRGWERWVHYARLSTTVPKLEALLGMMKWSSLGDQIETLCEI